MTLKAFTHELLSDIPHVHHGFYTRMGGVSEGGYASLNVTFSTGDNPEHVQNNRDLIAADNGRPLAFVKQVHGANVVDVKGAHASNVEADGMITEDDKFALGVQTADCVPVLIADRKEPRIAAVHAGWQGAFNGIVDNALDQMVAMGSAPSDIVVVLGPAIQQASYEVDGRFYRRFVDQAQENATFFIPSENEGHYMFDLPGYLTNRTQTSHPNLGAIKAMPHNTYTDEAHFFSHRRSTHRGSKRGGQLSVISVLK